jgi:hypothetical protein
VTSPIVHEFHRNGNSTSINDINDAVVLNDHGAVL